MSEVQSGFCLPVESEESEVQAEPAEAELQSLRLA